MNDKKELQRSLNPMHVWAIAFGCVIGWGSFVNPGKKFLPNSGIAGTAIAMILGALVMIIIAFSYTYMVPKYPKAGGEFTFTKMCFGKNAGYKREKFDALLEKYPTIRFIDNPEFNLANNISSLLHAVDLIDRCYICEADLYITNPEIINKYEYRSNYLGAKVTETDDWCFKRRNGYVSDYQMGGTDCYQGFGISYWNGEDSEKLKTDLKKVYAMRGGKENLWEQVPLKIMRKNYQIEIRKCHKSDIIEIDNFIELIAADPSYAKYPGYEEYSGR